MTGGLDAVGRLVYRSLQRKAKRFDRDPVLKALITRNLVEELPQPLDGVVARFLGGELRLHYWPPQPGSDGGGGNDSVVRAVRDAFRNPPRGATIDGGLQGLRYLTGLLALADKHQIVELCREDPRQRPAAAAAVAATSSGGGSAGGGSTPAARSAALQLLSAPEKGALLVSHPSLDGWFRRAVVLLGQYDAQLGAYGLCLNKPLGSSVRELTDKIRELKEGGGHAGAAGDGTLWAQLAASLVGLLPAAPLRLRPVVLAAAPPPLDLPTALLHGWADATATLQEECSELGMDPQPLPSLAADAAAAAAAEGEEASPAGPSAAARAVAAAAAARAGALSLATTPAVMLRQRTLDLFSAAIAREHMGVVEGEEEVTDAEEEDDYDAYDDSGDDSPFESAGIDDSDEGEESWVPEEEKRLGLPIEVVVVIQPEKAPRLVPRPQPFLQLGPARAAAAAVAAAASGAAGRTTAPAPPVGGDVGKVLEAMRALKSAVLARAMGDRTATPVREQQPEQARQQGEGEAGAGTQPAPSQKALAATATSISSASWQASSSGGSGGSGSSWQSTPGGDSGASGSAEQPPASTGSGSGGSSAVSGALGGAGAGSSGHAASGEALLGDSSGELTVGQVLALFDGSQLFRGGPVEGLQLLHRRREFGGEQVLPEPGSGGEGGEADASGVFIGAQLRDAPQLMREGKLAPEDVKVYIGDSGWHSGQLEGELAVGTWGLVRADEEVLALFNQEEGQLPVGGGAPGADMWQRLLSRLGPRHAAMARIPEAAWRDVQQIRV